MNGKDPMAVVQVTNKQKTSRNPNEVAVVHHNPSPSRIFALNLSGFYKVFDLLSLKELQTLGETCTFMRQVTGDYFYCSYGGADVAYLSGDIFVIGEPPIQVNGFHEFIRKIQIYENKDEIFKFIATKCKVLKQIRFISIVLTPECVQIIKETLQQIETIQIICTDVNESFRQGFLKCCTHLKSLSLRDFNPESIIIGTDNEWLRQKYSTLVHLELDLPNAGIIKELKIFFEQNENIRSFATNVEFLWKNREFFEVKLDDLAVVGQMNDNIIALLNDFHRCRVFKRLYMYNMRATQKYIDQIALLNGLVKLFVGSDNNIRLNLTILTSLKELALFTAHTVYAPTLAKSLVNLKRLYISNANARDILPFIQHSIKLNKIKILLYNEAVYPAIWNKEREKLFGASNLTVFVPETVYLAYKYNKKNTHFDMIEIRHTESYEWLHHFYYK